MKKILPYIPIVFITALMLVFPDQSIMYAKSAIGLCGEIIIPSLFPFFVCSGLLIYSGCAKTVAKLCRGVMMPLFNVSGSGSLAFVLGIISGYPLGAVTACQLYESGYLSKSEAERLLAFCNNSGPLFILGSIGAAIYSSREIGIALYVSHILAAITVGIVFRFYARTKHHAPRYGINQPERSFSEVFAEVLSNSISSILTVCGAVIFFSTVSNVVISCFDLNDIFKSLFLGIMELSGGAKSISETYLPLTVKLIMSAFVVGFAGICVHLQVMAIVKKQRLSLVPYIIGKLLHGIISALYAYIYFMLFPPFEATFKSAVSTLDAGFCMSSLYSLSTLLFLALFSVIFYFVFSKKQKFASKKGH